MQPNEYQTREQTFPDNHMFNHDPREVPSEIDPRAKMQPQQPRRHPTRNALLLCLLALVVAAGIIGFTGGIDFTSVQKTLPTRTFAINGHGSLIINDGSGTFHIKEGNINQIIVQSSEHVYGLANSLNDVRIQYAQQGNTVTLNATEGWGMLGDSGVDFTITVPANLDITLHGGSTDADMTHIDGQVNAYTGSGNLHLSNVNGAVNLNSGSGDFVIANEQGALNAYTASGNIRINQLTGPVNLSTASGDITLDQAQISGQDRLQTASGGIHFNGTLDPRGTYQMNTASGDITVGLPTNASFQLTASTSSGDINNAFGSSTTGNAPYAMLIVKTSSGNINLQKH